MRKRTIAILFILGVLCAFGGGIIAAFVLATSPTAYDPNTGSDTLLSISNIPLLIGGIALFLSGFVVFITSLIGALVNVARTREWVWFVLLLLFGWVCLIVYLFAGPKVPRIEKIPAYSQPHQDLPQLLYVQQAQSESHASPVRWD